MLYCKKYNNFELIQRVLEGVSLERNLKMSKPPHLINVSKLKEWLSKIPKRFFPPIVL
jgi:glycine cleavage system H lipoate-binding protein